MKENTGKRKQLLAIAVCFSMLLALPAISLGGEKSRLVSNLEAEKKQTVVAYGTSLTANGAWVKQLSSELNRRYSGLAAVINSGAGSRASKWGVKNLQTRVIDNQPDAVFIEFSINDASRQSPTTLPQARANLETMIDRILAANKSCEIILMVMNPPTGWHLRDRPKIEAYNQIYRDVAAKRHLLLIDHYPNWQKIRIDDPKLFAQYVPDGIHPNYEGCRAVITPKILSALGIEA